MNYTNPLTTLPSTITTSTWSTISSPFLAQPCQTTAARSHLTQQIPLSEEARRKRKRDQDSDSQKRLRKYNKLAIKTCMENDKLIKDLKTDFINGASHEDIVKRLLNEYSELPPKERFNGNEAFEITTETVQVTITDNSCVTITTVATTTTALYGLETTSPIFPSHANVGYGITNRNVTPLNSNFVNHRAHDILPLSTNVEIANPFQTNNSYLSTSNTTTTNHLSYNYYDNNWQPVICESTTHSYMITPTYSGEIYMPHTTTTTTTALYGLQTTSSIFPSHTTNETSNSNITGNYRRRHYKPLKRNFETKRKKTSFDETSTNISRNMPCSSFYYGYNSTPQKLKPPEPLLLKTHAVNSETNYIGSDSEYSDSESYEKNIQLVKAVLQCYKENKEYSHLLTQMFKEYSCIFC